jgi:hypothetical protein
MKLWQFVLIWLLIIVGIAIFAGCSTVYQNGKKVFQTSSNLRGVAFSTPEGTTLTATSITNSTVHAAIGNNIAKGATAVGSAILTSGIAQ